MCNIHCIINRVRMICSFKKKYKVSVDVAAFLFHIHVHASTFYICTVSALGDIIAAAGSIYEPFRSMSLSGVSFCWLAAWLTS